MPKRVRIELTEKERQELQHIRDHHAKPYIRERAAGVLKVAQGQTLSDVAQTGLLKRHEPETLRKWLDGYLREGVKAWFIKPGRGRRGKFSPSKSDSSSTPSA